MTDVNESIADFIGEFGGERTGTDARCIRLGDTNHTVDVARTNTGTGAGTASNWVR